jgi:hypothetical protein
MKIVDAALLLEGLGRYFTDVYKAFDYSDEADLRDYLEFVIHEPAEWMRGFPAKWKSAATFYRPRAAFHKLLKHSAVIAELGAEYCERVDAALWRAFKEDGPKILAKRAGTSPVPVETPEGSVGPDKPMLEIVDETGSIASAASRHSVRRPRDNVVIACPVIPVQQALAQQDEGGGKWKQKFEVLYAAYLALLGQGTTTTEGVRGWSDSPEAERLRKSATLLAEALRSSF